MATLWVILASAVATFLVGYGIGRLRIWRALGDWAVEQIRSDGKWVMGPVYTQVVVLLAWMVTSPEAVLRTWQRRKEQAEPEQFSGAMRAAVKRDPNPPPTAPEESTR